MYFSRIRCSWWPDLPDVQNDDYIKDVYTAILVLVINGAKEFTYCAAEEAR